MKYLLPLVFGLLFALHVPAFAQEGGGGEGYTQEAAEPVPTSGEEAAQSDAANDAEVETDTSAAMSVEEEQSRLQQMQDMANQYKEQYGDQMPSTEEMKNFASQHGIKPPSAQGVRDFATQHQGQFDKALDYAKQFQEFRREQREDAQTGSMAPE